jgi:hypothetical protein
VKANKVKYVEFANTTVANQQQYYFPDLNDIRSAKIFGIETWGIDNLSTTYSGATPIADDDLAKAYLVLYFEGGNFINIPLIRIIQTQNNATTSTNAFSRFPFLLTGQVITWSKSYIWFGNTSGLTTGRALHFNVFYQD